MAGDDDRDTPQPPIQVERGSIPAWLRFFRIKLLPTAYMNALTGAIAVGFDRSSLSSSHLGAALLAIGSLYLFGMGSNDFFDRHRDAVRSPSKPIPSGKIRPRSAGIALLLLGIIALISAALLPQKTWIWSVAISISIVAYNRFLKDNRFFGPLAMGSVRFFLVLFGGALVGDEAHALLPASIIGGYGFWVTRYSLEEESARPNILKFRANCLFGYLVISYLLALILLPQMPIWGHFGWIALFAVTFQNLIERDRHPPQRWTFQSLRGLLLLDGALQLSYNSSGSAGICLILYLWTEILSRRMTAHRHRTAAEDSESPSPAPGLEEKK